MAAVLCKGCSEACKGCCELLTIPCKLCGNCCSGLVEATASLCSNPFCLYVVVALAFNIPSISCSISPLVLYGLGCSVGTWVIGNIAFCAINIAAALYIATKFNELRTQPPPNQNQNSGAPQPSNSGFGRASYILCHDPFVAIYILILIAYFVWLIIGLNWRADGSMNCAANDGNGTLEQVGSSIGLGFSFFSFGFFALCCALCCSCCCNGDNPNGSNRYNYQNQNNQYGATASQNNRPSNSTTSYTQYNDAETADIATEAPVTATAVPVPTKTAPQQQAEPVQATVVPSAPPLDDGDDQAAAASGSAMGSKLGKLFNAKPETQAKLESTGAKASAAMSSGLKKASNMFK